MKKCLVYVSYDCFFDNDFSVLKQLQKKYHVIWYALMTVRGVRFEKEELEAYVKDTDIDLRIRSLNWRKRSPSQLFFDFKLLKEIKEINSDLVYIEDLGDLYFFLAQPFYLKKSHTVYAIHDVYPHKQKNSLVSALYNLSFYSSRFILNCWCNNFQLFSKSEYNKFIIKNHRKHIFYTPLPMKDFGKSDVVLPDKSNGCKILFFGTIEYYKGLDLLIKAAELLTEDGFTNFTLTVAGKGSYWNDCSKLIKHEDRFNIQARFIRNDEIADMFNSHHFLVLPYRNTTQSGPHMLAYNYDMPVVASNIEGLSDLIENYMTGFVFEKNNIRSLKYMLQECISMKNDDYLKMRDHLHTWKYERFGIEGIIGKYCDFFDKVISHN